MRSRWTRWLWLAGLPLCACLRVNPGFDGEVGSDSDVSSTSVGTTHAPTTTAETRTDGSTRGDTTDMGTAGETSGTGVTSTGPGTAGETSETGLCTQLMDDGDCDGVDDDCDGDIDEDYTPDASCGVGLCQAMNTPSSCVDGEEILCVPGDPIAEIIGDGVDQDCDGSDLKPGEPLDSFVDDFEDALLDPNWTPTESGACTLSEGGGTLSFDMTGEGVSECDVTTEEVYDLVGDSLSADIATISSFHPPIRMYVGIENEDGDWLEFGFDGSDMFYVDTFVDGAQGFTDTSIYAPGPRYWRISEQGGDLFLESSDDAQVWEPEFSLVAPFEVRRVHVKIGVKTSGPMPGAIGISVSNYNILP